MSTGSMAGPRVVIGIPLYNPGEHLVQALESLLSQSYGDVAFVLVDDSPTDSAAATVGRYAELDGRITYRRNSERLGLTRNWRRAFELATALHPGARYFAWGSDHDVWHPRWLEVLVGELDHRPEAISAYARSAVIRDGNRLAPRPPSLETTGLTTLPERLKALARHMRAGHMIYGLFRVEAVKRAGGYRHVLFADRLLLTEAALCGEIVQSDEILYYKRPTAKFDVERQRAACFPDRVPLYARLPWWLTHAGALAWTMGVRGAGHPAVSRRAAPAIAALYALYNGSVVLGGRWGFGRLAPREQLGRIRQRLLGAKTTRS